MAIDPTARIAAGEMILEGLHSMDKIGRSEERGFSAQEKPTRKQERGEERDYDEYQEQRRSRRGFN